MFIKTNSEKVSREIFLDEWCTYCEPCLPCMLENSSVECHLTHICSRKEIYHKIYVYEGVQIFA